MEGTARSECAGFWRREELNILKYSNTNDALTISLDGRVDSKNVKQIEAELHKLVSAKSAGPIILDCQKLDLISSAGLRMVLRLKQSISETKLINVSPTVYDVLQTTGFTELMEVHRAYRVISVKDCEKIGEGSNGVVYHYDEDTIVKTYWNPDALPEIQRERELARTAFVLGVCPLPSPTMSCAWRTVASARCTSCWTRGAISRCSSTGIGPWMNWWI